MRVTTPLGHTATLTMIGAGDVFGELALLTPDARRTATVVSLERTHTLALGSAQVAALRRQHPQIDRFLTGLLARHLRRTSALVLEALYLPVETRLARRLSQLARVYDGDIGSPRTTWQHGRHHPGPANGVLRARDRGVLALRRVGQRADPAAWRAPAAEVRRDPGTSRRSRCGRRPADRPSANRRHHSVFGPPFHDIPAGDRARGEKT